ncbi:hypothetical protein SDC9_82949 [bioreactor metagenome]|uniref:Tripartite ATP-independent periplasmic transporters DctQ component domain-containing protein n=1 Tax=bioreactor metagenome TaxID=1076179 RepID=A0A644ZEQ0_9ZZZZ
MQQTSSQKPWVNTLMKAEHVLATLIDWICAFILLGMMASMVWQVTCRFILKLSVPWTDELSRYLWISIAYIGAGAAISENTHVEISLIATIVAKAKNERTRRTWARIIDIVRYGILLGISVYLFRLTWTYLFKAMKVNMLSAAMHMPSWILVAVLAFGLVSMIIHSLFRLIISLADDSAIIDPVYLGKGDNV